MTPVDHLHTESKVLKVDEQLKMLCSQHLATCLQANHVSLPVVTADSGPRRKKMSLQMGFSDQVNDLLTDGHVEDIVEARRTIHTRAVQAAIGSRRANVVLGRAAPDVNPLESELPRGVRTTLAQLRSGYCSGLNTFLHRIDRAPSEMCAAGKLSTQLRISLTVQNTLLSSPHWIYGRDPEKLQTFSQHGPALTVSIGRGPHQSLPHPKAKRKEAKMMMMMTCIRLQLS